MGSPDKQKIKKMFSWTDEDHKWVPAQSVIHRNISGGASFWSFFLGNKWVTLCWIVQEYTFQCCWLMAGCGFSFMAGFSGSALAASWFVSFGSKSKAPLGINNILFVVLLRYTIYKWILMAQYRVSCSALGLLGSRSPIYMQWLTNSSVLSLLAHFWRI